MCMQCVAQSTPMVATGLVVLRRRSLVAFVKASVPFAGARASGGVRSAAGARLGEAPEPATAAG